MQSLDECAMTLSDFGITFNQSRVYITTAQLGIASVSHISRMSKVPREEIYRILPKLEKLGLVEKTLGRPIKIKATPVEDALSILIKREKDLATKRISALTAKKDTFLKNFAKCKPEPESEETAHFTLVSPMEAVIHKGLNMIKAAEREINISTSGDEFKHYFTNYQEAIRKSIKKGVAFRVILEKAEFDDSIVKILEQYESLGTSLAVRFADQLLSHYVVADYKGALVATSVGLPALGKSQYLWTNEGSMVGLLAKNFESVWDTSVKIDAMKSADVNEELIRFLEGLRPTNHLLLLYNSSEAKYNVLCNYLKVGLENGEATVYIASEENPSQIRDVMKRFGIEVERYEKKGALRIIGYNEFYIVNGRFNEPTTMGLIKKMYDEALAKGFKGCRFFGEMACFFQHNLTQEMMNLEKIAGRVLSIPIIGMCAYNANKLAKASHPLDLYNKLLEAHNTLLFTGPDDRLRKFEIRKA